MKKFALFLFFWGSHLYAESILFLGDSLTEGYGVQREHSYPQLLQKRISAKFPSWKVRNASISGSTSASCKRRLQWQLKNKPELVFIALGANDGLRGIPTETTKKNLSDCIEMAISNGFKTEQIILSGIRMAFNYGDQYRKSFDKIFKDLKMEKKVSFVPFLLTGVAGEKNKNQSDGIHPNEEGHKVILKNIYPTVEGLIKKYAITNK